MDATAAGHAASGDDDRGPRRPTPAEPPPAEPAAEELTSEKLTSEELTSEDLTLPVGAEEAAHYERRRTSFDSIATAYAAARPDWPGPTAGWLAGAACDADPAVGPPTTGSRRVLDLGAGTGKLTRALVAAGHRVVAVDVSEGMLTELRRSLPAVQVLVGDAEDIPLPAASLDAVVVGQAWHWFQHEAAAAECARVLRPGGVLGIGWHIRDERVAWVAELSALVSQPGDFARDEWGPPFTLPPPFGPVQRRMFAYRQRLTPAQLRTLAASWSYVQVHPERERVLDAVEGLGRRVAGPDGTVVIPHRTRCFRAVR